MGAMSPAFQSCWIPSKRGAGWALGLLLFLFCPIAVADGISSYCPPRVPGGRLVLGRASLTIIGEIHGTHEAPEALFALACRASRRIPVRIGLEIPTAEQERIDQFFRDGDREQLLAGPFWHRSLQDGRSSEAMLELLDQVRQLRELDVDINVFAFDRPPSQGRTRDGEMAQCIGEALDEEPQARFLILVGNVHARTVQGVPWNPTYLPMGAFLDACYPLISLNLSYRGGTAWTCTGDPIECGVHQVSSHPDQGEDDFAVLYDGRNKAGYDGELYVVELTAAPPAVLERN